ncbi:hypothetical protein AGMMS49545_22960 [Betaproteobacteria bacterium]|nr:hypothetical protein AGMMS49545_22960 [Betaproteobacteria bacterium]
MLAALGLIPFLLWVIVSIVHAVVIPDMRKFLLARVLIWIVAIAVVFGIFEIKHKIMRGYADEVVEKVKVYYAAHGHYPKTLAEIGIEQQKFKETLGRRSGYLCMGDAPRIFYTAPIDGFDTWFYDFAGNEWGFHPD